MFKQSDRSWFRRFAGMLAVLTSVTLLGVLPASPAQAQARRPVLLIGGTFATAYYLDTQVRPWLAGEGYVVDTVELATDRNLRAGAELLIDAAGALYGFRAEDVSGAGTASIDADPGYPSSYQVISDKVAAMLAANPGTDKVDIIGHSQGAVAARWYVQKSLERHEDNVGTLVSLGGPQRGVPSSGPIEWFLWSLTCDGAARLGELKVCPDIIDQDGRSTPFLDDLNEDPTPGNVGYYHLYGPEDSEDTFSELGFTSRYVPEAEQHVLEWTYPQMRRLMLEALQGGFSG